MSTPTSESLNGDKLQGQPRVAIDRGATTASLQADGSKLAADSSSMVEQYQPRPITIKQVDHLTITGSNPGDHRSNPGDTAKASLFAAADNGGPRSAVNQFPLGKNVPKAGPQSTTVDSTTIGG